MTPSSIERLVPDQLAPGDVTGRDTLELHLARYRFAASRARPGRVLDLACGVGYGTRLVADTSDRVSEAIGVDLAADAIGYATSHYARPGVRFVNADALAFTDPLGFATIISLETIEHVLEPAPLVAHLTAMLAPGGVLIASVPTTPSVDVNPHHLHDFTERSFRRMLARCGLREIACLRQIQPYRLGSVLARSEPRMADMRTNLVGYYARNPRAAIRRAAATLRHGFTNRYLTIVATRR